MHSQKRHLRGDVFLVVCRMFRIFPLLDLGISDAIG